MAMTDAEIYDLVLTAYRITGYRPYRELYCNQLGPWTLACAVGVAVCAAERRPSEMALPRRQGLWIERFAELTGRTEALGRGVVRGFDSRHTNGPDDPWGDEEAAGYNLGVRIARAVFGETD